VSRLICRVTGLLWWPVMVLITVAVVATILFWHLFWTDYIQAFVESDGEIPTGSLAIHELTKWALGPVAFSDLGNDAQLVPGFFWWFVFFWLFPIVIPRAIARRRIRRRPIHGCVKCRYELRAQPGDPIVCPECGFTEARPSYEQRVEKRRLDHLAARLHLDSDPAESPAPA